MQQLPHPTLTPEITIGDLPGTENFRGKRRGFSLVEVMVVLVLLGLMAVATAEVYHVKSRGAGLDEAMGKLAMIDAQARQYAQIYGQAVTIEFDLTDDKVTVLDSSREAIQAPYIVSSSLRIDRIETTGSSVTHGTESVVVSAEGVSPTYAVLIESSSDRQAANIVAGLSGQVTRVNGQNGWNDVSATISRLDIN